MTSEPLSPAEFHRLMSSLGPFEGSPRLAIAVSGGPDSMALALLAHGWAKRRRGSAVALTVDHGLRPEAAMEARRVGAWLRRRGVAHRILRWEGEKPQANIQAAARAARYALLEAWCRRAGVLHLLLAHQQEDQAETFLLRLGRGSGIEGLAAMAPLAESEHLRLLRPLLPVPRARLVAYLAAARQGWIEDPTNRDPRHARVRMRGLMPSLAQEGLAASRLAETARRIGQAREALEASIARLLARAVTVDAAGFALVALAPLAEAPREIGLRGLSRVIHCIGGAAYPPRLERLERLYHELVKAGLPAARTLGGCRVLRLSPRQAEVVLVCREAALIAEKVAIRPATALLWDGRFRLSFAIRFPKRKSGVRLGPLGMSGWAELKQNAPELGASPLPSAVRPSLPALRDLEGVLAVPHLNYGRGGYEAGTLYVRHLDFRPRRLLAAGAATVA